MRSGLKLPLFFEEKEEDKTGVFGPWDANSVSFILRMMEHGGQK